MNPLNEATRICLQHASYQVMLIHIMYISMAHTIIMFKSVEAPSEMSLASKVITGKRSTKAALASQSAPIDPLFDPHTFTLSESGG